MPVKRASQTRDKRHAILQAALTLFNELGFHAANVPLIAQSAGVAVGTIYHYFRSKEAIVNELYRHWKQDFVHTILDGFPFKAPFKKQFLEYWRRMAVFVLAHPTEFSFIETHYHAPYLDEANRNIHLPLLQALDLSYDAAIKAGVVKAIPTKAVSALILGTMTALLKASCEDGLRLDEDLLAQMGESLWDALADKGAKQEE